MMSLMYLTIIHPCSVFIKMQERLSNKNITFKVYSFMKIFIEFINGPLLVKKAAAVCKW
jgi:hypothetical protein